ncbi:hypothetical protein M2271_007800 [Streptomyces sp. LBL]|nr:hypothetical protein [Streptomyces sp. LBL]MDH6629951.1 hypothetical protein [Streptomyces sp. LBL]
MRELQEVSSEVMNVVRPKQPWVVTAAGAWISRKALSSVQALRVPSKV